MSLVNDALKRVKDAQPKSLPPPPGPRLRPAEPRRPARWGLGAIPTGIIALILLMSLVLLWLSRQKIPESQPSAENSPAPRINPAPEMKPPVPTVAVSKPKPPANPPKMEMPAPIPAAPAAPPLKLQAVFFAPGRSSAIISGKTVQTGDRLGGFRVAAIGRSSATLVSATQTNVMTLGQ